MGLMPMTSTSLRGHASGATGGATGVNQNRRRQSSATTANVDIEVPAAIMTGSGGIVDRTLQVGSPPSSSGGSIGSESERIHRALILGGIEQDGLVLNMSDHENRLPRPTWLDYSRIPTYAPSMPRGSPSCLRTSNLPDVSVGNVPR